MRDPEVIQALLAADDKAEVPIEGWDDHTARLANVQDLLQQIVYTTSWTSAADAPTVPRPTYPHEQHLRETKSAKRSALIAILIPEEV